MLNLFWEDWHVRFRRWYNFTYTLVEYGTFTYLLYINIESKRARVMIIITSFFFVGFVYFFNFVYHNRLDSIPIGTETLLLLIIGIYFFYEQFKNPQLLYVYGHYCFWITMGILVYLCGSFFIFLRGDSITAAEKDQFWFLTYVFEIVKNICFGVAIVVLSRKPNQPHPDNKIPYLDLEDIHQAYK